MSNCNRIIQLSLAAILATSPAVVGAGHRYVLLSATENLRRDTFELTHRDLPTTAGQSWSVRSRTLHGGKQEGVQLVTIDNGRIQITVCPTRGMSIMEVRRGKMRLGWDSPIKEVVHPQHVNLEARGGLGWLDGFNEWMVRCGLEFAGQAGPDRFVTNTGAIAEMNLTLHGKIGNIPASEVVVIVDPDPPHRIRLRGVVHERMFYGPKLELLAELSTVPGTDSFRIDDTVTNRGASDQEFQLIYHANFGPPLMEASARFEVPIKHLSPRNEHAAKAIDQYATYKGPTEGFIEEVFLIEPLADLEGRTMILLRNAAGDIGSTIQWSTSQLPYLTIWKNTAAVKDGYLTGLEPSTGFPYNRSIEREHGRVPKLAPEQTRRFTLNVDLLEGREKVKEASEFIALIQAQQEAKIDRKPLIVE